jgi:hypothetical protein
MHSGPNPVYHRDIREPNIIKRFDGPGWFLIDWSDASTAPTRAVTHLKWAEGEAFQGLHPGRDAKPLGGSWSF